MIIIKTMNLDNSNRKYLLDLINILKGYIHYLFIRQMVLAFRRLLLSNKSRYSAVCDDTVEDF